MTIATYIVAVNDSARGGLTLESLSISSAGTNAEQGSKAESAARDDHEPRSPTALSNRAQFGV